MQQCTQDGVDTIILDPEPHKRFSLSPYRYPFPDLSVNRKYAAILTIEPAPFYLHTRSRQHMQAFRGDQKSPQSTSERCKRHPGSVLQWR